MLVRYQGNSFNMIKDWVAKIVTIQRPSIINPLSIRISTSLLVCVNSKIDHDDVRQPSANFGNISHGL